MSTPVLPPYTPTGDVVADKVAWRRLVRAARRSLTEGWGADGRERAAATLTAAGVDLLTGYAGGRGLAGLTVTAVEPMRTEPPWTALTDALRARGVRVLVPLTLERPHLDWVDLDDPGRVPLGEGVLADVDVFLVPALAVSRAGVRLGQGGGYYDSTLPRAQRLAGGVPVVAVVHDHEVVESVPADAHDAVVDAVLTTGGRVHRP